MPDDNMEKESTPDRTVAEQLNAIIDSSFDGLWISDGEGRVVRINKASEEINDIRAEQVLNRKMEDLVAEGLIDRSVTLEVLKRRAAVTMIQHLKNGKQVLVTGNPVFDKDGKISLVVVNDRDITELNKLRAELEESRALSHRYRRELSKAQWREDHFPDIVARSATMHRVFDTALRVAEVDSTVLIQGESGVGKGLVAKLIHRASKRKDGPFIRVDCGAIPEPLIESELFGYEPGAFTGALTKGKPGYFEMAEAGTLFLDEIGELPKNIQVKLLRFMEENEVVRIGGTKQKKIDTRIIAATHRDLGSMVQESSFRKDLFFRLNVVPLRVPPLRERPEDIPPSSTTSCRSTISSAALQKPCGLRPWTACVCTPFPAMSASLPTSWNSWSSSARIRRSTFRIYPQRFAPGHRPERRCRKSWVGISGTQWSGWSERP